MKTGLNIGKALFTDFYQLTMVQLYFLKGLHKQPVNFEYFYRSTPRFSGNVPAGFCIFAGIESLFEWMKKSRFSDDDIKALAGIQDAKDGKLFQPEFLEWLYSDFSFSEITICAVSEGRIVHAGEPLVTVTGPVAAAQILETPLLNSVNYQTLVATNADRISRAACGCTTIEFGMRRGPGSGTNAGTRASLIGGMDYSSNTGVSLQMGIPPKGTHAHSMVQLYKALGKGEEAAFEAYAEVYPENCLLLVDTVNTLKSGIPAAIRTFSNLRRAGKKPMGIRLDSGDPGDLVIKAAGQLNDAGFTDANIVISDRLDEFVIEDILRCIRKHALEAGLDPGQLIKRLVFGVGTRLVSPQGAGVIDGVYKLTSVKRRGRWLPSVKLTESVEKRVNPGRKQLWRLYGKTGRAIADYICLYGERPWKSVRILLHRDVSGRHATRRIHASEISAMEPMLKPAWRREGPASSLPMLTEKRNRRSRDLARLSQGHKDLHSPKAYFVGWSSRLWDLRKKATA